MTREAQRIDAPLAPYRVLDLCGELGWLCGKILADLGADVVKVEPPGGDPGRHQAPLLEGVGLAWLAFNVGKRSIVLDLEHEADRELLLRLVERADFLLESFTPGCLDGLGLGFEQLKACNPRLVMASITPYGQLAPNAGAPASDLEIMAAGGPLWLTGDPDMPPVRVSLPQAHAWTGAYASMGVLTAHHHRQLTGVGQHVDVSAQAAMVPILVYAPMFWSMLGEVPSRSGPDLLGRNIEGAALRNVWPCADGYVCFALYGGAAGRRSNRDLAEWMRAEGKLPADLRDFDWDSFEPIRAPKELVEHIQDELAPFFASLTKAEFSKGCATRRVLGYVVATAADIAGDAQLEHRQVWQDIVDPGLAKSLRYPSGWARFGEAQLRITRPVPRPGEHQAEVLAELELAELELEGPQPA